MTATTWLKTEEHNNEVTLKENRGHSGKCRPVEDLNTGGHDHCEGCHPGEKETTRADSCLHPNFPLPGGLPVDQTELNAIGIGGLGKAAHRARLWGFRAEREEKGVDLQRKSRDSHESHFPSGSNISKSLSSPWSDL